MIWQLKEVVLTLEKCTNEFKVLIKRLQEPQDPIKKPKYFLIFAFFDYRIVSEYCLCRCPFLIGKKWFAKIGPILLALFPIKKSRIIKIFLQTNKTIL